MKLWNIAITAQSPLVFPVRKPGEQFRESLPFVPGGTLYGALGALQLGADLLRSIRCHNAYPAWPDDPWSHPLPLTAAAPKGAATSPSDTMIDRVCWERMRPTALIYAPTDFEGRGWEATGGCYAPAQNSDTRRQTMRTVTQRVMTRASINRRRGTAEDQRLYSFLAISEVNRFTHYTWDACGRECGATTVFSTLFLGSVSAPDDVDLAPPLTQIDQIGGRITTGMGVVTIKATATLPEDGAAVAGRIRQMTEHFASSAARYAQLRPTNDWRPEGDFFTVNLLSDAILYEEGWRPTTTLTADLLREVAKLETADLTLLRAFALPGLAGGWNVSWPGAKPTSVSTGSGSVFVFHAPHGLTPGDADRLADLQLAGIGDRRPEGYGHVRICDDFHLDAYALKYEQFLEEHR